MAQLQQYLSKSKSGEVSVIYVTHKLDEVLVVAVESSVLRDGEVGWDGERRGHDSGKT